MGVEYNFDLNSFVIAGRIEKVPKVEPGVGAPISDSNCPPWTKITHEPAGRAHQGRSGATRQPA